MIPDNAISSNESTKICSAMTTTTACMVAYIRIRTDIFLPQDVYFVEPIDTDI